MTIIVTAAFTPKDGTYDQVVAALSPAIAEVHEEPGCLLYAIHESPNGQIMMIEKWESAELLDAHGAGDPVKRLNASLAGLLANPWRSPDWCQSPPGPPTKAHSKQYRYRQEADDGGTSRRRPLPFGA